MKKRKTLTLSAILLAAVFALSCCFFAACNKDEDTHEHTYDAGVVTKEPTCTEPGEMTYTCVDGDDSYTEEIPATGHTWVDVDVATPATCGEDGIMNVKCSNCGETGTQPIPATEQHTFTISDEATDITWNWDKTDYTATATVTCDVCKKDISIEATVTGPTDGYYIASVTIGGSTYTNSVEAKIEDLPYDPNEIAWEINLDFNDPSTYGWITAETPVDGSTGYVTLENGKTYKTGILSLVASDGEKDNGTANDSMTIGKDSPYALFTAGSTSTAAGRYFAIDLTGCAGDYIVIEATFASNSEDTKRSLYVSGEVETPKLDSKPGLKNASSESKKDVATLNYGGAIGDEEKPLYLTCDGNIRIYTLDITIYGTQIPNTGTGEGGSDVGSVSEDTVVALPVEASVNLGEVSFSNENELEVSFDSTSNTFTVGGTPSTMTSGQAEAFGGEAYEGDKYVVIGFQLETGDTISWTTTGGENKSWTKAGEDDLAVIERVASSDQYQIFTLNEITQITVVFAVDLEGEESDEGAGEVTPTSTGLLTIDNLLNNFEDTSNDAVTTGGTFYEGSDGTTIGYTAGSSTNVKIGSGSGSIEGTEWGDLTFSNRLQLAGTAKDGLPRQRTVRHREGACEYNRLHGRRLDDVFVQRRILLSPLRVRNTARKLSGQ